ncbi:23S rRNA pseudouridine(1911/1915/1917) synthase RluD [Alkanindiges sp. WGS2144]|uniref:23S rRNA pseudouridine(1911/1915/1917) synthase RluD n=1 Tax=Alkanindiges sp. WGS2144 TaxID=3366808 RepID=UPI0037520B1D
MAHTQNLQQTASPSINELLEDDNELFEVDITPNQATTATQIVQQAVVADDMIGLRFDQVAASVFAEFSRERLKHWMQEGQLTVNGNTVKPKARCLGGEMLSLNVTLQNQNKTEPEDIPLDIIYEDDDILVVNKPVGLVVHPGAGNWSGTLVNGLLYHDSRLDELPRAGLVHRIDKDTSGLLVIAKNLPAQHHLSKQLADKSVYRVYDAVVVGHVIAGGTIDQPIRRHPVERTRMSVQPGGRPSVTHYRVLERFGSHTLVQAQLETGRTHQIRVHLSHTGFPLVGDSTYGGRIRLPQGASQHLINTLKNFKRQALHARKLGLIHPVTGKEMQFEAPWPQDFSALVEALRQEARDEA